MTIKQLAFDAQQLLQAKTSTTCKRSHVYELLSAVGARLNLTNWSVFNARQQAGMENRRSDRLMDTLDAINGRYGRGALRLAAEGVAKGWQMRQGNLSPRYTTEWAGVTKVIAG